MKNPDPYALAAEIVAGLRTRSPFDADDSGEAAPDCAFNIAQAYDVHHLWAEGLIMGAFARPDMDRLAQYDRDDPRFQSLWNGLEHGAYERVKLRDTRKL